MQGIVHESDVLVDENTETELQVIIQEIQVIIKQQ